MTDTPAQKLRELNALKLSDVGTPITVAHIHLRGALALANEFAAEVERLRKAISRECDECHGKGLTDSFEMGEVECGSCQGTGIFPDLAELSELLATTKASEPGEG